MDKTRFSMLVLEPGEIYFEDYSCTMKYKDSKDSLHVKTGRLKLCSKSLVFEPKLWKEPLLKLHFKDCIEINIYKPAEPYDSINAIRVKVKQYATLLEKNILAPYKFNYEQFDFYFIFDFANAEECLRQMHQLQRASTLLAPEHNSMVATILHSRFMRMVFDPVMMDDFSEEILCEVQAEKISPLVKHQGKLALTPTCLYFQPFNNIEGSPIVKLKLNTLRRMYKRRFLLRHVGLEIYFGNEAKEHIYLSFRNECDRDTIYSLLEKSPHVNLDKILIEETTLQWQNGIVSNFDYLCYLNCLADRSKNDLTQYPVFPWIVADYKSETLDLDNASTFRDLSRPMGALNIERQERLMERYHEMSEPKFMYGSHYSAPGLVLFYLVRKYPQYMLCLQNGRFDHPDRMFNSVADVYNNCIKNMSDFKELIPEFYDTESAGDFLVNKYEIDFGERHDGTKVNNVKLPPWAASPEDFISKLRHALESDYVSKHLHLWIDLIFGYKQRGEEAVKAYNVFYHLCYEGSVNLECIYDMNDRHALEVQIMEFGQVPKQLFTTPHVRKITHQIPRPVTNYNSSYVDAVECIDCISLHREAVTCVLVNGPRLLTVGKDGTLKVYDRSQQKQIRSVALSQTPLSSCAMLNEHLVAVGSWDNDIYLYDVEYGRTVDSFRAHDDSVSCILWLQKEKLLVSGGSDGVVRVWAHAGERQALRGLKAEFDHDGNVTALTYRRLPTGVDLITGTSDGEVSVWRLSTKEQVNKISVHGSSVKSIAYLESGERVVTSSEDGDLCVTDLNVSHSVYQKRMSSPVTSMCFDDVNTLWLGCGDGSLLQWDMLTVTCQREYQAHDDSIESLFLDMSSHTIASGSKDKSVKLWQLKTF